MSKKSTDTPASTRIRENQRRSRNRRKELIEGLQKRVQEYEQNGVAASLEMQQAARKVVQENAGLRSLLALHGVTEGEVNEYLRSYNISKGSQIPSTDTAIGMTRLRETPSKESSEFGAGAAQACCRSQGVPHQRLDENIVAESTLNLLPANRSRQFGDIQSCRGMDIQTDDLSSDTTIQHTSDQRNPQIRNNGVQDEPECPNTADCFCPPSIPIQIRPSSHNLEISCEAAATIIVEMRGDGDIDSARAALGCLGREECNVKNSTVLQIMDEG